MQLHLYGVTSILCYMRISEGIRIFILKNSTYLLNKNNNDCV